MADASGGESRMECKLHLIARLAIRPIRSHATIRRLRGSVMWRSMSPKGVTPANSRHIVRRHNAREWVESVILISVQSVRSILQQDDAHHDGPSLTGRCW